MLFKYFSSFCCIAVLLMSSIHCNIPVCVEVSQVVPLSLVRENIQFIISFTKPVQQLYEPLPYPWYKITDVFLTHSINDSVKYYPYYLKRYSSSLMHYEVKFKMYRRTQKAFWPPYLVIDGGRFYTLERRGSSRSSFKGFWTPFVPLSIFGPYGTNSRDYDNPIIPSPYCYSRPRRIFDPPTVRSIAPLNITVAKRYNKLLSNGNLQLALTVSRTGEKKVKLPKVTTAKFKNHKVSVLIPETTISIDRKETSFKLPAKVFVIHELIERVYHSPRTGFIRLFRDYGVPRPSPDFLNVKFWERGFRFAVKATNKTFIEAKNYRYSSYSGSMDRRQGSRLQSLVFRKCDPESVRSRSIRSTSSVPLYHAIEYGPYYLLIVPSVRIRNKGRRTGSGTTIKVNDEDVTKFTTIHRRISKSNRFVGPAIDYFTKIMEKYAIIAPAGAHRRTNKMVINKHRTIKRSFFVPKKYIKYRQAGCNGVHLFRNPGILARDKEFCNKPFGDCIGLPFPSKLRFPDLPVFGSNDDFHLVLYSNRISIRQTSLIPLTLYNITIKDVVVLRPQFHQSSCTNMWSLNVSPSTNARLILNLTNTGEGGVDVMVNVKCSSFLDIYPVSGIKTKWIKPGESFATDYQLDSIRAVDERAVHKCEMRTVFKLPEPETVLCSQLITTFSGLFEDPCVANESVLPDYSMRYFVLPSSQLQSTLFDVNSFLRSQIGTGLVFMRAITISIIVKLGHEDYLPNFNLLQVNCHEDAAIILDEVQLINVVKNMKLMKNNEALTSTINYTSSFGQNRKLYFFAKRSWLSPTSQDGTSPNDSPRPRSPSGCRVELFANRPVRQCESNPVRLKALIIPLVETEIQVLEELTRDDHWYFTSLYGSDLSMEIINTLISSLVLSMYMIVMALASHILLIIFRKKLPRRSYFNSIQDKFNKDFNTAKKRWENPQMYLETGALGTYYTLHNFKCTHPLTNLSQDSLKNMKVAGLLKYKEKEQQVLFSHVKKIFLNKKSAFILLQASSGMYLLKPTNVHEEYKMELQQFYKKKKIVFKEE